MTDIVAKEVSFTEIASPPCPNFSRKLPIARRTKSQLEFDKTSFLQFKVGVASFENSSIKRTPDHDVPEGKCHGGLADELYQAIYNIWHRSLDSSVGRAVDCSGTTSWQTSIGHWFESGSRDNFVKLPLKGCMKPTLRWLPEGCQPQLSVKYYPRSN